MPHQLTLVALIRAKPGKAEELGRRLLALVEPTRAEPGCINYDVHRSNDDPALWIMHENWHSPADLDAHFRTPYLKDFIAHSEEPLAREMDLYRCTMMSHPAPVRV